MKLTDIIFESIYDKEIIKEGGNAVANVERINKIDINSTIDKFISEIITQTFDDVELGKQIFLLGSTGKKESSGDLDIGFDATYSSETKNMSIKSIIGRLYEAGTSCTDVQEIKINEINPNMIHLSFPQYDNNGNKNGKLVQIDILVTVHPDFCKFYMYSPSESESSYKGAHRNDLLRACAQKLYYEVIKTKDDEIVTWKQYDISDDGIYLNTKTIVDKDGNRLKWNNTNEDLQYGYAKNIDSEEITTNPQKAINMLVGNYKISDIDTFEKLLNIIENDSNFIFHKSRKDVLKLAANLMFENTRIVFPKELKQYLPIYK